jgi:hypothetical protein
VDSDFKFFFAGAAFKVWKNLAEDSGNESDREVLFLSKKEKFVSERKAGD